MHSATITPASLLLHFSNGVTIMSVKARIQRLMAEVEREAFEANLEYILVEIDERLLLFLSISLEGNHWIDSGVSGWMYRVGQARPEIKLQRNIHIAREKHTGVRKKQASWNKDGTRHDRSSFNENVGKLAVVQAIARSVLKIPDSIALEAPEGTTPVEFDHVEISENQRDARISIGLPGMAPDFEQEAAADGPQVIV